MPRSTTTVAPSLSPACSARRSSMVTSVVWSRVLPANTYGMQLLLETLQPTGTIFDRLDGVLKDNLLGSMLERLRSEPACMRFGPMLATAIYPGHGAGERKRSC